MTLKPSLTITLMYIGMPILVYLCVKFGTYAYYKAKELAKRKKSK